MNFIFDWSGTLSNDLLNVVGATNLMFREYDVEDTSVTTFRGEFDLPIMDYVHRYLPNMTQEEQNIVFKSKWDLMPNPTVYPGVRDVLTRLSRDHTITILSAHFTEEIEKEARLYGIDRYIHNIYGRSLNKLKDIDIIMSKNQFNPEETVFVGDMKHDIDTAKHAGVISVAITWGYQSEEKLRGLNPDFVISDIRELEGILL